MDEEVSIETYLEWLDWEHKHDLWFEIDGNNAGQLAKHIRALIEQNKRMLDALDVIASNNGLALSWMSTAPMPMERYKDNCYEMMNIARAALGEKKDD